MTGYEEKLKLVEKFSMTRERITEIKKLALTTNIQNDNTDKIVRIADAILEEL